MDVLGCLAAYVSTTSTRLVVSSKGRQGGYSLRTDARLKRSLTSVTLKGIVEWLITGKITRPYTTRPPVRHTDEPQ